MNEDTPTKTTGSAELEEILIKLRGDGWTRGKEQTEQPYEYTLAEQGPIEEAYAAIQAHTARQVGEAVNEARIDEVNRIPYWGTPYGTDVFGYEKLFRDTRLAQLTTNQEDQS